MAKCWKCGKEIHGFRESLLGFSTCPECETLEVLKKMQEEQQEKREAYVRDDEPLIFEPTDRLSPVWWKKARNPKAPGVAAILAFLMGEWGIQFMYIGKSWTILGIGMFVIFPVLLILYPIASCVYLVFTNFLCAGLFICMDDDDFLKRFRYDLWIDKQIADQYGHKVDEVGNYTDVPLNKPSWDEVFHSKSSNDSYSNVKEEVPPLKMKVK